MRRIAMLVAVLSLGCAGKAEKSVQVNAEFKVETLFTDADGYTVKRFRDNGEWRYYVTPGPAAVISPVDDGKHHRDGIETK